MSYISAIGTANPPYRFRQSQIANFMVRAMQLKANDERRLKAIFNGSGIDYRYSVLKDYGEEKDFTFYTNTSDFEPFPSTARRLSVFKKYALDLSTSATHDMLNSCPDLALSQISHLIVVCCTGMYAPGLDIDLVKKLGLTPSVQRTGINFMGCYGAFNAIKVADAICRADDVSKVLIVCTELCSLHFQKEPTNDNLISSALFSDGAAAILVEGRTSAEMRLSLRSFHSDIATEGEHEMAWAIGDLGFQMKLSTQVPAIIKSGIREVTNVVLKKIGKKMSDIRHYAIHPGGKKILEGVEEALELSRDQNKAAYTVLREYGNMSSPTILFVLQEICKKLSPGNQGDHVLCFAFGPGLTLESMVLKIELE